MFGTDYTRERIHDNARKQLADCDDAAIEQLWGKVTAAFNQWKQEHGNRKPKANMGMLSDLLGPKPISFKKAAPWQCADLPTPSPLGLADKLIGDKYAPFLSVINEAGFEKVLAVLILGSGEASTDDLQPFHEFLIKNETAKSVTKQWQMIEAIKERQKRRNLDLGPIAAAKNRTEKAAIKNAPLISDIQKVLVPHPFWSAKRITDFLLKDGNPYGKTPLTILADVKDEKTKYRKARS
jgi:hypothetical protein